MPTTYSDLTGQPVYNFPTETKEDFDAINKPGRSRLIAECLAELETMISHWEADVGEHPEDDLRQKILGRMRELADKLRQAIGTDSVPEANTD